MIYLSAIRIIYFINNGLILLISKEIKDEIFTNKLNHLRIIQIVKIIVSSLIFILGMLILYPIL